MTPISMSSGSNTEALRNNEHIMWMAKGGMQTAGRREVLNCTHWVVSNGESTSL